MSQSVHNDTSGWTLLEVMIATAISLIATASIFAVYTSQIKTKTIQDSILGMQQNLRAALYLMGRDLRTAGYEGLNYGANSVAGITVATATSFQFTRVADDDGVDNDGDGILDEYNELDTIGYGLYAADGDGVVDDIGRTASGTQDVVAENIQGIDFLYVLGDVTATETHTPSNLSLIRAVRLTILARSLHVDQDFTDSKTYACPIPTDTSPATTWGPFQDGIHRHLMTGTFMFRNMGN